MSEVRNHNCLNFCIDVFYWKNPIMTVSFLVLLDIGYLIINSYEWSLVSITLHKFFFLSLLMMAKRKLIGECQQECQCFTKESVERVYIFVYGTVNHLLDKLRKIILLHEIGSLVRLLVSLFFIITFGPCFSTRSLIVIFANICILMNFGRLREHIKSASNVAVEITTMLIRDALPKYKEVK